MGYFKVKVYHEGWFTYQNGPLYLCRAKAVWLRGGEYTIIVIQGPAHEDIEENLKLFKGDADSIAKCKIAELRDYVELYVVHKVEEEDVFPVAGYIDVGEKHETVDIKQKNNEVNQEVECGNSGDSDNFNSEYKPSGEEDDNEDDFHFTDSDDELDPDVSGFQYVNVMNKKSRAVKKKGVANENFENDERGNSDELDLDHEDGAEGSDSEHQGVRYPVHKAQKDMNQYNWELAQWLEILHSKWLGKAFKKKVGANPKVKIRELVSKAQKKWNLTVTKSMASKTNQIALDEIQGTFREQYKRIYDYGQELLRANPGSSIHLQHSKKVSNKGKQQKRSTKSQPPAAKGGRKTASSQPISKLAVKRKAASATQPSSSVQSNNTAQPKRPRGRPKKTTMPNCSTQHDPQSKKLASPTSSAPPSSSSQPTTRTLLPSSQPTLTTSSSQPVGHFSARLSGAPHVSPKKLKLMAKLSPRKWGLL
ncbi:hypothetical protein Ahy_A09g044337 [Arachis hypogaea]|uniref:Uncharacterized protein n=1 Tax=Arachis hypogaea TaxID=3818 RepID=A0A445BJW7_ARAHY|nr:hypothetical protein Ahy_A09g044337 [Arachis hypogaea]